jgi:hypothetical protein
VVSQAGGLLLTGAVRASGLDAELSRVLAPWRNPLARHDPAKVVADLAIALGLGGDCLADIAVLRGEPGVFGPVASDPTVSRTVDALACDVERVLKAIDAARAAARATVWGAGRRSRAGCRLRRRRSADRRYRRDTGDRAFGQAGRGANLQAGLWIPSWCTGRVTTRSGS